MKIRPLHDRILVTRVAEQEVGRGWGPCLRRPAARWQVVTACTGTVASAIWVNRPGLTASHRVHRHRRDVVREPVALGALQREFYREAGGEG